MEKGEALRLRREVNARRARIMQAAWRRRQHKLTTWRKSQGWSLLRMWVPTSVCDALRQKITETYGEPPAMSLPMPEGQEPR